MAPAYNTIPAAADEQDSLLAPKKDTSKLIVQSFTFASGNCIKDYGSKTLHYVGDGQGC